MSSSLNWLLVSVRCDIFDSFSSISCANLLHRSSSARASWFKIGKGSLCKFWTYSLKIDWPPASFGQPMVSRSTEHKNSEKNPQREKFCIFLKKYNAKVWPIESCFKWGKGEPVFPTLTAGNVSEDSTSPETVSTDTPISEITSVSCLLANVKWSRFFTKSAFCCNNFSLSLDNIATVDFKSISISRTSLSLARRLSFSWDCEQNFINQIH